MLRMMMGQHGLPVVAKPIESRLAFLKTELKITDAQLPLWNAFAKAMRDDASTMEIKGGAGCASFLATITKIKRGTGMMPMIVHC